MQDASRDNRFADNPLVTADPKIRFYAGVPLIETNNYALGTLCVIDRQPRDISVDQLAALQALARQITGKFELRRISLLLESKNEEFRNLSLTDELTGLYDRRGFMFHAEQQLKIFRSRRADYGLWVMMVDIDGLKAINDNYGHAEGSFVINKVGELLRKIFRGADIAARLGGDEFVVLIINALDEVKELVHKRLALQLAALNAHISKPYPISISYGMVSISFDDKTSIEEMMEKADDAMYENKRSKKHHLKSLVCY